ncbi:MAG: DUF445 family protein [Spirochaetaceae bacterium]|nr:MAG: DUF445 family protein [Spirochaetaceae bacterium]
MTVSQIVLFAVPPLAGAVIGYVTNALAIKMLFRPLKAVYLGPLRLPFTPGIIPRQRERLAESIASMVGEKLLTSEAVGEHLNRPGVEAAATEYIAVQTERLLKLEIPAQLDERVLGLADFAADWLVSPSFGKQLQAVFGHFFPSGTGKSLHRMARRIVIWFIVRLRRSETGLLDLLPPGTVGQIRAVADAHYDELWARVIAWLRNEDTHSEMVTRGRRVLFNIMQRLKSLQRLVMAAGGYGKNLDEQMPVIVSDLVDQLERFVAQPENRQRMLDGMQQLITDFANANMRELELRVDLDLGKILLRLVDGFFERWQSGDGLQFSSDWIVRRIQHALGMEDSAPAAQNRQAVSRALQGIMQSAADRLAGMSLAGLVHLQPSQKARLDAWLTGRLFASIQQRLPDILAAVDVQTMVRNKVNSLNPLQVEGLLLQVMQRHLKYINIFGALLGALIGGSQVILSFVL